MLTKIHDSHHWNACVCLCVLLISLSIKSIVLPLLLPLALLFLMLLAISIPVSSIGKIPLLNCLLCFRIELSLSHWFFTRHLLATSRVKLGYIRWREDYQSPRVWSPTNLCVKHISTSAVNLPHAPSHLLIKHLRSSCSIRRVQPGVRSTKNHTNKLL